MTAITFDIRNSNLRPRVRSGNSHIQVWTALVFGDHCCRIQSSDAHDPRADWRLRDWADAGLGRQEGVSVDLIASQMELARNGNVKRDAH